MGNKINRVVASGLLALMIANFTACDNGVLFTGNLTNDNDNNSIITTIIGNNNQQQVQNDEFAKGDVWEALKQRPVIRINSEISSKSKRDLLAQPLPITFLQEEGLLYFDDYNFLNIHEDSNTNPNFVPLSSYAFVDDTTNENDVYLLVQYQNKQNIPNKPNKDVYLATWQLKYTLSDADYSTFLKLAGDWRARIFIQEMDKIYQPEVLSKSIISYNLLSMGSHLRGEVGKESKFPAIFVTDVDYDNQIVSFGSLYGSKLRYIDVKMRESNAWNTVMDHFGLTEQERENQIQMNTKETQVGKCLTSFSVNYLSAGLTKQQAVDAFNTTSRFINIKDVNVNSFDSKYSREEIVEGIEKGE